MIRNAGVLALAFATSILVGPVVAQVVSGAVAPIFLPNGSQITDTGNGTVRLTNTAGTGFAVLSLGPTTSSFPRLAVSGSNIMAQLGDGSAKTGFQSSFIAADGSITAGASIKTGVTNVAGLSTCSGNGGLRWIVNDSTVAASGNFGTVVAGGGSNVVPVYCDNTNWRIG